MNWGVWHLKPRWEKNSYKKQFWDSWGNTNMDYKWDDLLGAIMVLWLCRRLSLSFGEVGIWGEPHWHLQRPPGSEKKPTGVAEQVQGCNKYGRMMTAGESR
jgi:hypothetical protein